MEARIAAWTFLPQGILVPLRTFIDFISINSYLCATCYSENGEPIQILRYERGQKYEPHFDFFMDKFNQEFGGHRVATVLIYLSDVDKGGETVFPRSEVHNSDFLLFSSTS